LARRKQKDRYHLAAPEDKLLLGSERVDFQSSSCFADERVVDVGDSNAVAEKSTKVSVRSGELDGEKGDKRHSQQDVEYGSVERLELVDPDPLLRRLRRRKTGRRAQK